MESNGIKSNIHHILHVRKCFKNSFKNPIFSDLSFLLISQFIFYTHFSIKVKVPRLRTDYFFY